METTSDWTQDEFKAYVLLYAANSHHIENRQERNYILSKINKDSYQKVHDEFDKDNDFQSIQKIIACIERFEYSKNEIEHLTAEIMELFLADDELDAVEQAVFTMLKRVLNE